MDGRVQAPRSHIAVAPLRSDRDRVLRRVPTLQPASQETLGHPVRSRRVEVPNARAVRGVQHVMAAPLQFSGTAIDSEVLLPSKSDIRRAAKCGEAKTKPAHNKVC